MGVPAGRTYDYVRYQLLLAVEGYKPLPYVDDKGNSTVGIGVNVTIRSNADRLFNLVFGSISDLSGEARITEQNFRDSVFRIFQKPHSDEKVLNAELSKVLNGRSLELSKDYARELFVVVANSYDDDLKRKLGQNIPSDIAEHAAVFSLWFNRHDLVNVGLQSALDHHDHSEAWYEIRYATNKNPSLAVAKRRYYESQVFGATDHDDHLTVEDARGLLTTRSRHITAIESYDRLWEKGVDLANIDYDKPYVLLDRVEYSHVIFNKAKSLMIAEYGHGMKLDEVILDYKPITMGVVAQSEVNRLDTTNYVIKSGALIMGGEGNDVVAGSPKPDVLLGQDGNDNLNGAGGADVLKGGAGADRFGFSKLIDSGDHITDFSSADHDQIVVTAKGFGFTAGAYPIVNKPDAPHPSTAVPTFLYEQSTGRLFVDNDGTGPHDAILVAVIDNRPMFLFGPDIVVV